MMWEGLKLLMLVLLVVVLSVEGRVRSEVGRRPVWDSERPSRAVGRGGAGEAGDGFGEGTAEGRAEELLYQADLFEGDILGLTAESVGPYVEELNAAWRVGDHYRALNDVLRYQAIRDESKLWPDAVVPYEVSSLYTAEAREVIEEALRTFSAATCLTFRPRSSEEDFVFLSPAGGGCSSFVGRQGGRQRIQLGPDCLTLPGIPLHELMHSIGFFHEQSRADRDAYVRVNWDNVHPVWNANFRKYQLDYISHLDAPYDFDSVMHYGPFAFSRNGRRTLEALDPVLGRPMGQRRRLSDIDVLKINRLYDCVPLPTQPQPTPTLPSDTTTPAVPVDPNTPSPLPVDRTTTRWPMLPTEAPPRPSPPPPLPTEWPGRRTPPLPTEGPARPTDWPLLPTEPPPPPTEPPRPPPLPTEPTRRPMKERPTDGPLILYHPYECFVREDQGKALYWPAEGWPRSHYRCEIRADPRSWRGFRPHLRRLDCEWSLDGRRCSVPAGKAALCWNRFYFSCPADRPIPKDRLPPLPTSAP